MSEIKHIARQAASVWAGQVAVMAFGITDTVVAGRYADQALAALSVGSAVYFSIFVALMAVLQALLPVWSELQGAQKFVQLGQSVRQSLYLCAITAMVGLVVLAYPAPLLRWTDVPLSLQHDVKQYLAVLALAFVPALLFRLYSTLNQSLGRPWLVTWLQLGALALKVPLAVWFTFGGFGVPAMGAVGCAWSTVVVMVGMLVVAVLMLKTQPLYQPYALWQAVEAPDWRAIGRYARLGIPTGLAVLVEVTSFTLMALFIARQGTIASAAHQIASNVVAVMYMLPLAIAIATSARASFWMGALQANTARHAIFKGFTLVALTSIGFSAVIFAVRMPLASLYASNPQVVQVTAELLVWIALFHIADAHQAVCAFVLRSYRIAVAPLVIYAVLLWGVGLGGAYVWAYVGFGSVVARPQPSTFWIASTAALYLAAFVMMGLLSWVVRLSQRHESPPPILPREQK